MPLRCTSEKYNLTADIEVQQATGDNVVNRSRIVAFRKEGRKAFLGDVDKKFQFY